MIKTGLCLSKENKLLVTYKWTFNEWDTDVEIYDWLTNSRIEGNFYSDQPSYKLMEKYIEIPIAITKRLIDGVNL